MYSSSNKKIKNIGKITRDNVANDQEAIHQNKDHFSFQ
jgi:hypothetical protein